MIRTLPSCLIWAFFAACNLALVQLTEWIQPDDWAAVLVYLCVGTIPAQAGLLAIWFVLWPQASLSRTFWCIGIASVLFVSWAIGYLLVESSGGYRSLTRISDDVLLALCWLPVFQLAVQSPLWFTRAVLRWRIERPGTSGKGLRQGNLTIRGILIGTAFVALTLAFAKAGFTITTDGRSEDAWLAWGVGVLSAACIALAVLPPALLAVMRARSPWLGSFLFLIYVGVTMATVLCICRLMGIPFLGADTWRMIGFLLIVLSMAVGICVALLDARRRGFRLTWGREEDPPLR